MQEMHLQENGSIHSRLMKNRCPKCEQKLKIKKKTADKLERLCENCRLTIIDKLPGAEYPYDVCD